MKTRNIWGWLQNIFSFFFFFCHEVYFIFINRTNNFLLFVRLMKINHYSENSAVRLGGSQSSLSLVSTLQVAPSPHHDWSPRDDGGGGSSRFLRKFTPLLLLSGLFRRQGILLLCLHFLQFGLIEDGDFTHVRLVYHFLKTIPGLCSEPSFLVPAHVAAGRALKLLILNVSFIISN